MTELDISFDEFESHLEVHFQSPDLLVRAMTHRSYVNEHEEVRRDNERLEFLGDAILDFVVADMLFRKFPDIPEGDLTQLRSALVRTDSLAKLAAEARVGEFLLIGKGEENNGGRFRVNNLCRGFEALIGAIYMDQGLETVKEFVIPRLDNLLDYIIANDLHIDARSQLQERSQAELRVTPKYRVVDAAGPDHEKQFLIEVVIDTLVIGTGLGTSKRMAAQSAAREALKRLETLGWPEEPESDSGLNAAVDDHTDDS